MAKVNLKRNLWYERIMALIAAANLGLVFFDMTYVPWRDFWLQRTIGVENFRITLPLPNITPLYDPIKGIEPNRDTQRYLKQVEQLDNVLDEEGVESAAVKQQLQQLSESSTEMIATNPFAVANKSGTLEKIKNRMRDHIYGPDQRDASATEAFKTFWSVENLKRNGVRNELNFFDEKIEPLIETNYYRSIGEDGQPQSLFFAIDSPFVMLFGFELLLRSFLISRRFRIKFLDAVLWRWYDLLLLIPFWRFLRIMPVMIRLDQAQLISLQHIRNQATRGFVSNIAAELTEAVLNEVLGQIQVNLKNGNLGKRLVDTIDKPYVDLNEKDEIQEIVTRVLNLTVYQVLPKIRSELEAVLRHPIEAVMEQAPGYGALKSIPLVGGVPDRVNQQLVSAATEAAYESLVAALNDKEAAELTSQLVRNFGKTMVQELQAGDNLDALQTLMNELIEEIKINYVDQISQNEVEIVMNAPREVRRIAPRR